jgi:hypothetical protein
MKRLKFTVHRAADRLHPTAGRGGHSCRQGVPQGWDQRGDLLQLPQEVSWLGPPGGPTAETTAERPPWWRRWSPEQKRLGWSRGREASGSPNPNKHRARSKDPNLL